MIDDAWSAAAPDLPRWVEVRSMLLHGDGRVVGTPQGGFVIDQGGDLGGMVGRPDDRVLAEARRMLHPEAELLVVDDDLAHAESLLAGSRVRRGILHLRTDDTAARTSPLPAPGTSPGPEVTVGPVDETFATGLPDELGDATESYVAATSRVDGGVVAVCGAYAITETFWDVGIDTLATHRRRGHARACFLALDAHLRGRGLAPVWGAYEDNHPSLALAASLGFRPVDDLWVIDRLG